jgi:hypothetical protein
MANTKTIDFLPPIFQTETNRQFLSATLDQLVQEPEFKKTQGFIGRHVGPGVNPNDKYVVELDSTRANYQLEPGVVSLVPGTNTVSDAITYPGILDALSLQGADVTRADRLFTSDYYTWDPFVNFDKFINFSQYYWLPAGPQPVDVFAGVIPLTDDITVTRTTSYAFSGTTGENPVITLVRGGNYNFEVNQSGNPFWIQATPGISGTLPWASNLSSRDVYGVTNNGADFGVVSFSVPQKTAQEFYYNLTDIGTVDLVTNLKFNQINNVYLSEFLAANPNGIDDIINLENMTVVFTTPDQTTESGGWLRTTRFDPISAGSGFEGQPGTFDSLPFDLTTPILNDEEKYGIWLITYQYDDDGQPILTLTLQQTVVNLCKFRVLFGSQWANVQWYKDAEGVYQTIPLLTAVQDVLYYQDGTNPDIFGQIHLIDENQVDILNVDTIFGLKNYTSPNGVVFTNNMIVQFRGNVTPISYQNNTYYVAGVGTAIQLLPTTDYITPETYTKSSTVPYDSTAYDDSNYDSNLNQPVEPDYITIALDSLDLNAWTRSNRWFHIDVITAASQYNKSDIQVDNSARAKRPIIEFRGGTKLFNMGTQAKQPVNMIDFQETDALSNVNGSIGYNTDGYPFVDGSRVIFAADVDPDVRNKIYLVEFISPSSDGSTILDPIINLVPAADSAVLFDQCIVCTNGNTSQGISFYFDGINWIRAQEKTSINQAPLFDVVDSVGTSFGNIVKYPSSTFAGSKLFSYATAPGAEDDILGFALKYLSLKNIGDIVFDNNLYTDSFIYVENNTSIEKKVSDGFVRQYLTRTEFVKEIGWQNAVTKSNEYQQFSFIYAPDTPLILDVVVSPTKLVPSVKVYVGSQYQDPGTYTVSTTATNTIIVLSEGVAVPGEVVEVLALSTQTSKVGFYQVPSNLESNPLNQNSINFTLGTIRSHYESIAENLLEFTGKINGANNIRDLGNIIPYGQMILQQSSPLTLSGYFLRSNEYQIFDAINYNSSEYEKFKAQLLNTAISNDYEGISVPEILTSIIEEITLGRTSDNPFYWSDMLPAGSIYTQTQTTITPISTNTFDTVQVYNFTSANYLGLLVYLNGKLLTRNREYVVSINAPSLTITVPLTTGDVVTIQEYSSTAGSFVPNTPTKMGLYPSYVPEIYLDESYTTPIFVIRGHDGSITVAFGDFRDELLLEFETRIYNNLKTTGNAVPLTAADVIPGQFRTTDYSLSETNRILAQDFLSWVGWNKLDYKLQTYDATNQFTWNYSTAGNKLSNDQPLVVGAWRGIYNYFYDTITPNTRPWEMLGFSEEPVWWQDEYGPAPYTSGNLVLWNDLATGTVKDPVAPYVIAKYARPNLQDVIPSGSEGNLLSPLEVMVGSYDPLDLRKSWVVGDDAPVESAWRTSSAYPFAIMRLLALTRPAEFFSLFADRDLYKFDVDLDQYLYNGRYRLDANGVEVYGNGVSKSSYINWIVDYNRRTGIDTTATLAQDLASLDIRLCYRMAAFTGKNLLQIYTEKSSPNSVNSTLLLPDESYNLLFYKNVPFDRMNYSSVIIQSTTDGYAVYGYSTVTPYFNILASEVAGRYAPISAGGYTVNVPIEYSNNIVQVPYGYVFPNRNIVADFLLSYGQLLQSQGMVFDSIENGYILDWNQMVSEFLYWSAQGWEPGSVINLNPAATKIVVERPLAIIDSIALQTQENMILDQNRQQLDTRNLIIDRVGNKFTVTSLTGQTINYMNLKFVNYENMIIFDNTSIFADLIYQPTTAARQSRLKLIGTTTDNWDGQLNAPGFILNQDNIQEWQPYRKYTRGEIVKYKNFYYSALGFVQPSVNFDFGMWTKSDYTRIQQGLLPNLPNKSDELANSYDIYKANLETDQDLFSYGLIGFRPRQYMEALNLNDVSQVNLYRQFLGTKGTTQAAEIFTFADLGRGVTEYKIYENWAVQRGIYGANANRSFYELQLNEALLQSNPSTIQVTLPPTGTGNTTSAESDSDSADQEVYLNNVWKESFKLTGTDILTTIYPEITDTALPGAGYVDLDDVDITVFDIDNPVELNANLNSINIGTTIWAAKVNNYDWNIYRAQSIPGNISTVVSNLDGTSIVIFSKQHGLKANDIIIIKYFSGLVDGVYRVVFVSDVNSIVINFEFTGDQLVEIGEGIAFFLQTQRVAQASDVVNLPYANTILPGARVWVDNNGRGHWQVIEKQDVFTDNGQFSPTNAIAQSNFGCSVAQATENLFSLVGSSGLVNSISYVGSSPTTQFSVTAINIDNALNLIVTVNGIKKTIGVDYSYSSSTQLVTFTTAPATGSSIVFGTEVGGVYTFVKTDVNPFDENSLIQSTAKSVGKFGWSTSVGNQSWMAIGAPASGGNRGYAQVVYRRPGSVTFESYGFLTAPDIRALQYESEFGYSVGMSLDERWLYIGSPGENAAYAYGRVDVEEQVIEYITDGFTNSYNYSDRIVIDQPPTLALANNNQLLILLNNTVLTLNIDYALTENSVLLSIIPAKDQKLVIMRRETAEFTGDGVTRNFSLNEYFYTATNIYSFIVNVNGVQQRPNIDFEFDDDFSTLELGRNIIFNTAPPIASSISVAARSYFKFVDKLTPPSGTAVNARFGHSISCTTDGRQVFVGCPADSNGSIAQAGSVYMFDRAVQKFIVSNTSQTSYTVNGGALNAPTSVLLNSSFLTNTAGNLNGTFSVSGGTVTLETAISVGDVVEVEINEFNLIQKVVANDPIAYSNFGKAVDGCNYNCSLYVGAPDTNIVVDNGEILQSAGIVDRSVNQSRVYGNITSLVPNPILVPGDTLRINDMVIAVPAAPNNTVAGLAAAINSSSIPNVVALSYPPGTQSAGLLTLIVKNYDAALESGKLSVLPGQVGTAFADLGFETYAFTQTLKSPNPSSFARFGSAVFIDTSALHLVVGAPTANLYRENTFDRGTTYFDSKSTIFNGPIAQSGAIYLYDYLPSAADSVANPGKFVFGQQVFDSAVKALDLFGTAVDYTTGILLIGSPGSDLSTVDNSQPNYGRVGVFHNLENVPAWTVIHAQQPVVDVALINSVYVYDRITSAKTGFFDFIDPLQGKILGAARQNIDFIGAVDPGLYNVGTVNNNGRLWGQANVGQIWWDTNNVRFIDPNQNDIVYASRRWSQPFPGSSIDVYQWVASTVPPANYTGEGVPRSIASYTIQSGVSEQGMLVTMYYFWVRGLNSIASAARKTLSITAIAQYIEDPRASGIPYVAFINASTTALYNAIGMISAQDTILNIEFDRQLNEDNVHVQYELIPQDRADGFLSDILYRKFQDSLCGVDTIGNKVPDVALSPANRYGVQFRPRQSMFADRFVALENYFTKVNSVMSLYPLIETRSLSLLNSRELPPTPASNAWDKRVANLEELSYQNFREVAQGYRYLVDNDSTQNGLWTIYQNSAEKTFATLLLIRIQNYDTRRYWNQVNWYLPGWNVTSQIITEVSTYSVLETLSFPVGSNVRVKSNAQGKWEIYQYDGTSWTRVALQDGTIELKQELWDYQIGRFGFDVEVFSAQYYDQEPVIETRKIIQAINEELLIGNLLIERNRALMLMFNYVLTEFNAPEWLVKTSLIDVDHKIRQLLPYQNYQLDNQDFVVDYINEVKPYHVQTREINLIYDGFDEYQGSLTDFDIPAYFDNELIYPKFISPVLTPYNVSTATGTGTANLDSDTPSTSPLWSLEQYASWFNNYLLEVQEVVVTNGGTGYLTPPVVMVSGDATTPAKLISRINSAGQVVAITVLESGSGYSTTPAIEIIGGSGEGAKAFAVMGNDLVRTINTTIKFDRFEYTSNIVDWAPNTTYASGTQVRYLDRVWQAAGTVTGVTSFNPDSWTKVSADSLTGINRTQGFYAPTANQVGLDLPLLIDGLDYPGVQVTAPTFNQDTGYDIGNFDINPFDNISYGPEGKPTYDPAILDAIYESPFLDQYLGTRATDINVDGGEFVDTYSSHAPQELVPGSEFDTLDLRVYTRPGSDWDVNGHGFNLKIDKWVYNSIDATTHSFNGLIVNPVQVRVANLTQKRELIPELDYSVSWTDETIVILNRVGAPAAANGDTLVITVYGIGGGSQLFKDSYNGASIGNNIMVPVAFTEINETVIFVNGLITTDYTYFANGAGTEIVFNTTYGINDYINVTVFGVSGYSWSTPITQYFVSAGELEYVLDNNIGGTNPANLIVEKNGIRARAPEGIMYTATGTATYELPTRGGYDQSLIADNDVQVWINNSQLVLGVEFNVDPYISSTVPRTITFTNAPSIGSEILIAVWTKADYVLQASTLVFRTTGGFIPIFGDIIGVTSWNDTAQQNIVTQVFQGPIVVGVVVNEPYDSTDYDIGTVNNDPGSFDYTEGVQQITNNFVLTRPQLDPTRLWVTVNGARVFYGDDYLVVGQELLLHGPVIGSTTVVVVQEFTDSIVPEELSFRIFQDMRAVQATYRITSNTTTTLTQALAVDSDIIYVADASALLTPNLAINIWGVLTVDGERIMYRDIDTINNTVSGLRRGTAGTGAAAHEIDAIVYNLGQGNLAPIQYQDHYVTNYLLGDGATLTFVADDINLVDTGKINMSNTIQVYVGGILQTEGYTVTSIAPATVEFATAPAAGYQVALQVRQGLSWYQPGLTTASDGNALQQTQTEAAQFLRGN